MDDMRVQDVYHIRGTISVTLSEDARLIEVISRFCRDRSLQGVFLVDSQRRLKGIITRAGLLMWARQKRLHAMDWSSHEIRMVLREALSGNARDVVQGDCSTLGVKTTDTLQNALGQMVENAVIDIPVLDAEGRVLGDLTLSELLDRVLHVADENEGDLS